VDWLPATLPAKPNVLWRQPLPQAGLGGIAATDRYVVFGDRDADDFHDVYRCLDADTGETIWEVQRLAIASLDYGNSPRATPLISGDRVFFRGAHGHLLCVRLEDGEVVWERNFRDEFPLEDELPWGYCGSPLLVGDRLIIEAGTSDVFLLALDASSGELLWKSTGSSMGYGSLNVATLGGVRQIVGHDKTTLGGWDLESGKRLWTVEPEAEGDFNVPTPQVMEQPDGKNQLLIATENNGVRLYDFDEAGVVVEPPAFESHKLRTDMTTPVVVGAHLYCVKDFLFCLDARTLDECWRLRDRSIGDYASLLASNDRLLVVGKGELMLLGTAGQKQIVSRMRVFDEKQTLYSYPAMVGRRLYLRGQHEVCCLEL